VAVKSAAVKSAA